MNISSQPVNNTTVNTGKSNTFNCGTLTYTRMGLFVLFAWLLWGDFCFTLMEAVVPTIMPLKMKSLGCPNWLIGAILTAAPGVLDMTVCPFISFKSDRFRSCWGRRIPFILGAMPFLCVSLTMLGFSDDLCLLLRKNSEYLQQYSTATVTIALIAVFLIVFQFFNLFVSSIFMYLFNDVVPAQFLSRFMGAFRIVGTGASAFYNCFIFQYASTHMREIFIGAALLYLIGFGLVCLMIKEGQYPAPTEAELHSATGLRGFVTFFRESFSHKFYWFRFLSTSFAYVGWSIATFTVFFNQEMGLTLGQIGTIIGISSVVQMSAMYFMAVFVDRWHPLRISVYGAIFAVLGYAVSTVWIFVTLPGNYFYWLNMGNAFIGAFLYALVNVSTSPCQMRIFPKSRYGQFCSAQWMLRSSFYVVAGVLSGLFIDVVKRIFNGSDFAYRFIFIWLTVFSAISAIFMVLNYREWYRLGGDKHFHPPAPWSPSGTEELPVVPIVGPQTKWLNFSFLLFDLIMGLSTFGVVLFMWWIYAQHKMLAFKWYGLAVLPLEVLAWLLWIMLKKSIQRDILAARNGLPLKNGIPHHGMLIVFAAKFLLAVGIWVFQVIVSVNLNMESGAVIFSIANAITNFLLIGTVYLLCRIERGNSNVVDEVPEIQTDSKLSTLPA